MCFQKLKIYFNNIIIYYKMSNQSEKTPTFISFHSLSLVSPAHGTLLSQV